MPQIPSRLHLGPYTAFPTVRGDVLAKAGLSVHPLRSFPLGWVPVTVPFLSHMIHCFPFQWIAHSNIQRCYYFSYFRKRPTSLWTHNPSNCCIVLKLFGRDACPGCLRCLSGTHFYFWPLLKFVFSKLPVTSTQSIFSVFC